MLVLNKQTKEQKKMSTTETMKELVDTCKLLKTFVDLQSTRIDELEEFKKKSDKIFSRYQMTADSVEGVPFPEVEAKQ